jgi:hypothetical protein
MLLKTASHPWFSAGTSLVDPPKDYPGGQLQLFDKQIKLKMMALHRALFSVSPHKFQIRQYLEPQHFSCYQNSGVSAANI